MRVTNSIIFREAVANLQRLSGSLQQTQQEIGSGKQLRRPSDDPVSTSRVLGLRRTLGALDQFARNHNTLNTFLGDTELVLQDVENLLLRARTVTLQAANDTFNPANRVAMATEIEALFAQALQFGNRSLDGRFIFAGYDNQQPPFSATATIQSSAAPLTASGTLTAPGANDLTINNLMLRAPTGADDTVSTSDNTASALAIATVVNTVAATTRVSATAETALSLAVTAYGTVAGNEFVVNGVPVTGAITDEASLVAAVNAAGIPGLVASSAGSNNLTLTAADGRNVQLQTDGSSAGAMEFVGFDLGAGVALDQTATGTVTLSSNASFTLAGANANNARFLPGHVNPTARYTGDDSPIDLTINTGQTITSNIVGPQFLLSDLHPNMDRATPLASLRQGQGVSAGSIQITDRIGNTATIDLSAAITVGNVIDTISAAAGVNVTAAVNAAGNGLVISDDNATPTGDLSIAEVGAGTTASALGIAINRPGAVVGTPLRPQLTTAAPLSLLYEGKGVNLTSLHIANALTVADVDLSTAQTIGEVITAINASATNVTASINAAGTALQVRSNTATTVAIVTEVNGGTTATDLGIQGARDTLQTLSLLQEALQKNDLPALQNLLLSIDESFQQLLNLRTEVAARTNRVALVENNLIELGLSRTALLSTLEDSNTVEAFTRLSQQEVAFQAALATTARIIQPTLLDFLR